jgi:shikimate 5-dehydrogenase
MPDKPGSRPAVGFTETCADNGGYSRAVCLMLTRRSGRPELRVVARSEEAAALATLAVNAQPDLSARTPNVREARANALCSL